MCRLKSTNILSDPQNALKSIILISDGFSPLKSTCFRFTEMSVFLENKEDWCRNITKYFCYLSKRFEFKLEKQKNNMTLNSRGHAPPKLDSLI